MITIRRRNFLLSVAGASTLLSGCVSSSVRLGIRADYDAIVAKYDASRTRVAQLFEDYFRSMLDLEFENQLFQIENNPDQEVSLETLRIRVEQRQSVKTRVLLLRIVNTTLDIVEALVGPDANIRIENLFIQAFTSTRVLDEIEAYITGKQNQLQEIAQKLNEEIPDDERDRFSEIYESNLNTILEYLAVSSEASYGDREKTLSLVQRIDKPIVDIISTIGEEAAARYISIAGLLDLQIEFLLEEYNKNALAIESESGDTDYQIRQSRNLERIKDRQVQANKFRNFGARIDELFSTYISTHAAFIRFSESNYEPGELVLLRVAVDQFAGLAEATGEIN